MSLASKPLGFIVALGLAFLSTASALADDPIDRAIAEALKGIDAGRLRTGVLYDRVLPLSRIERYDGRETAPAASPGTWRQIYDELRRATTTPALQPTLRDLVANARAEARGDAIPLAVLDYRYERIDPISRERGRAPGPEARLVESRAFAFTALKDRTHRGAATSFVLDRDRYFTNAGGPPRAIEVDFADGRGFRGIDFDQPATVRYAETGAKTLRARVTLDDGTVLHAAFPFAVEGLVAPTPNDTLQVTATTPYLGQFGAGEAYVYLAPAHAALTNPIVIVEGFDLDNSMNWDELYALLNRENLVEDLRAQGFDAVVLNFADATDYLQRNAFVVAELIAQLESAIDPAATIAVVGASMGGLCSRYALATLESLAIPHRVRTWISFDSPHQGADIPLGIQYWVQFFAGQSAEAAQLRDLLNRPAARQMLVYHYTDPPGATGQPDPLRAAWLADLAAAGSYPALPRRVAIANGSGSRANQGFTAGDQIVQWEFGNLFVDVRGNVWAVPDQTSRTIFSGRIRILISDTEQAVTVTGTSPFDGSPGGWRASMADMDAVAAPFGDIVALHPHHSFIPTISALDLQTADLFYDVAGDPSLLDHTPFDAVYFPAANQEHVFITSENAAWFRDEVTPDVVGVSDPSTAAVTAPLATSPNPFHGSTRIGFGLARAGRVDLQIFAVDGRTVRSLLRGALPAGPHEAHWDGLDERGIDAPAGLYFVRLEDGEGARVRRVVKIR
jgi:hypothetical protein